MQLHVFETSEVTFLDRATNYPSYFELRIQGKASLSDAFVEKVPNPLPEKIRLLYHPSSIASLEAFKTCRDMAIAVHQGRSRLIVQLFLNDPNDLIKKIEGGMMDMRFNSFVIKADDSDIASIGCTLL